MHLAVATFGKAEQKLQLLVTLASYRRIILRITNCGPVLKQSRLFLSRECLDFLQLEVCLRRALDSLEALFIKLWEHQNLYFDSWQASFLKSLAQITE